MRVFTISDLHLDYDINRKWLQALSLIDYQKDILLLAGDISDDDALQDQCFEHLKQRFARVFFVTGNHDLWIRKKRDGSLNSLQKFEAVMARAARHGVETAPALVDDVAIQPIFGWYDFSFGQPSADLRRGWMDFITCRWPDNMAEAEVTTHFLGQTELLAPLLWQKAKRRISFSHFLPRIDVMPARIPERHRLVYPVLGANSIGTLIGKLRPDLHIYGHSHVNHQIVLGQVTYINNALGYPNEAHFTRRKLFECIFMP